MEQELSDSFLWKSFVIDLGLWTNMYCKIHEIVQAICFS